MSNDLSTRRLMVIEALKILRDDDMAQDDAIKHYEKQLAEIDEKIKIEKADEALRSLGSIKEAINKSAIPDVVINLKPGIIRVNSGKEKDNG